MECLKNSGLWGGLSQMGCKGLSRYAMNKSERSWGFYLYSEEIPLPFFVKICHSLGSWGLVFVLYCLVLFKAPQLVPSRYQIETQTLGFLPWCRALSPQNYRMLISIIDIERASQSSSSIRVVERAKNGK